MADDLRINTAELHNLLDAPDSPVVRDLTRSGKRVERGAKRRSRGRIRAGVNAKPAARDGLGWYVDVATDALSDDGAPIGLFTEAGTAPHEIRSKGDYPLRSKDGRVFGKVVQHPGTKARPHLRPALHEDL